MKFAFRFASGLLVAIAAAAQQPPAQTTLSAAGIVAALAQAGLDPQETYRVRDLQLSRGDIKIYLSEGVLSFVTPIAGKRFAAVFTTQGVEAGDAEILALPPQPSERASLASFTKTPNLDEHFTSAVFVFSDQTASELIQQIQERELHKAADIGNQLAPSSNPAIRQVFDSLSLRLVEALLNRHDVSEGFLYGVVGGRQLGPFNFIYDPGDFEPVAIGRSDGSGNLQLWTSFRPRHAPPYAQPLPAVNNYRIDATIHALLTLSATAVFNVRPQKSDGRVLRLGLSDRLKIDSATIDGVPAEVLQRDISGFADLRQGTAFLLIANTELKQGTSYAVEVHYHGSVVRQIGSGSYAVDERSVWFPFINPTFATFDLTFRCPARLRLVSSGELVSEEVIGEQRIVHRKTVVPEAMAGFNLGEYQQTTEQRGPYRVECYANRSAVEESANIAKQTGDLLEEYSQRWIQLPIHNVAVSPVPGYFGQGFPGLIYLSNISYIPEQDRPAELRNPRLDTFFSELLLPHEVAHQWWGNIVAAANYRTSWLSEAMASYSALQILSHTHSAAAVEAVLNGYRTNLTSTYHGRVVDSIGPVDFGIRLLDSSGMAVWHTITYEKGAWIFHMLVQRLGEDGFRRLQLRLLDQFAAKPITNEDLQRVASEFVPKDQPDKTLALFFETWVYGTGIPKMTLNQTTEGLQLLVSGVEDDFTADVPLRCQTKDGKAETRWVRASGGTNDVPPAPGGMSCSLPSPSEFLYLP